MTPPQPHLAESAAMALPPHLRHRPEPSYWRSQARTNTVYLRTAEGPPPGPVPRTSGRGWSRADSRVRLSPRAERACAAGPGREGIGGDRRGDRRGDWRGPARGLAGIGGDRRPWGWPRRLRGMCSAPRPAGTGTSRKRRLA